jgi:hypothetical protein
MGGRSGGQHGRMGAVVGVGDHSARAAELDQGRVARQRGTGEARWGGGVRYGGAWAAPGERGPARGEGKGAGLERKEDGPCPKE